MGRDLKYFVIYKPFLMLSQFTPESGHRSLGELHNFPKDVYSVGRLDSDSEGMLILTNDKSLNHKLLHPSKNHTKTYWIQVDGDITKEAVENLKRGVTIRIKGKENHTKSCQVKIIDPNNLPDRTPPVRFRKNIPTSWIEITLTEGKNRQVRRMTASVGFPTLRIIRVSIENLRFDELIPESVQEYSKESIYKLLDLK